MYKDVFIIVWYCFYNVHKTPHLQIGNPL